MEAVATKREPMPLNGVDTPTLFATINAVKAQPELAKFTWRASNRWAGGTHSESQAEPFTGAGGDHPHAAEFEFDGDHPAVLVGKDKGPTPVELLLYGLAACLTAAFEASVGRRIRVSSPEGRLRSEPGAPRGRSPVG